MSPPGVGRVAYLTPLVMCATMAGCAATSGDRTAESVPGATAVPRSPTPTAAVAEVPSELLERVVAEAADRQGVGASAVNVVTAEAVTWSDGSLGCPEPGMMYTQALVPGYRVVVAVDGDELSFHAGESGEFRFCEDPEPPVEGSRDS